MINIEGLVKHYGSTCAVNNLDLTINKGEVLGLLGPNGAGKSTTLRIITGFLKPTDGSVSVNGLDVKENPVEIKNIMGYLPESAPLYQDMLVYDYLDYSADMKGLNPKEKNARLVHLASLCGIREVMHKSISSLSKGYKQRVGLAYAMMGDPEILILDEPTSGLDPNQIVEIRSIIKEIGKTKTVIFSTHILSEAEATCDRVVIINKGEVVADGTPEMLNESIKTENILSVELKKSGSWDQDNFSGEIQEIDKIEKIEHESSISYIITSRKDIRSDIYAVIKNSDAELLNFNQEKKSLEHIFRALTKETSDES